MMKRNGVPVQKMVLHSLCSRYMKTVTRYPREHMAKRRKKLNTTDNSMVAKLTWMVKPPSVGTVQ